MRVTSTTLDIEPAELAELRQVLGLDVIDEKLNALLALGEVFMANFDALNAKVTEVNDAVASVGQRISDDVQALKDQISSLELDTQDQAAIDEITGRLDQSVQALNAIDPIPPVTPDQPDA